MKSFFVALLSVAVSAVDLELQQSWGYGGGSLMDRVGSSTGYSPYSGLSSYGSSSYSKPTQNYGSYGSNSNYGQASNYGQQSGYNSNGYDGSAYQNGYQQQQTYKPTQSSYSSQYSAPQNTWSTQPASYTPTQPPKPTNWSQPTQQSNWAQPTQQSNWVQPAQPTQPTNWAQSTNPWTSTPQTKPAPVTPTVPTYPSQPTQQPTQTTQQPVTPTQPVKPSYPSHDYASSIFNTPDYSTPAEENPYADIFGNLHDIVGYPDFDHDHSHDHGHSYDNHDGNDGGDGEDDGGDGDGDGDGDGGDGDGDGDGGDGDGDGDGDPDPPAECNCTDEIANLQLQITNIQTIIDMMGGGGDGGDGGDNSGGDGTSGKPLANVFWQNTEEIMTGGGLYEIISFCVKTGQTVDFTAFLEFLGSNQEFMITLTAAGDTLVFEQPNAMGDPTRKIPIMYKFTATEDVTVKLELEPQNSGGGPNAMTVEPYQWQVSYKIWDTDYTPVTVLGQAQADRTDLACVEPPVTP